MFTGIIEQVGEVADVTEAGTDRRFVLTGGELSRLAVGASIAVNGVCLTAVGADASSVTVDVVPETLGRTTLGRLEVGDQVNLELPLPASGRFDGHIVQGHVDGIGEVTSVERGRDGTHMTVAPPQRLMSQIVEQGSVTVDGVSLTVAGMNSSTFSVALIPHTLEVTTLGLRKPGDVVNLETDIVAKYVQRMLKAGK